MNVDVSLMRWSSITLKKYQEFNVACSANKKQKSAIALLGKAAKRRK